MSAMRGDRGINPLVNNFLDGLRLRIVPGWRVGVINFEPARAQILDVINASALQIFGAVWIDEDLEFTAVNDKVVRQWLSLKPKPVLKCGGGASFNLHA